MHSSHKSTDADAIIIVEPNHTVIADPLSYLVVAILVRARDGLACRGAHDRVPREALVAFV